MQIEAGGAGYWSSSSATSQRMMVSSRLPVASVLPSGEKATEVTSLVCSLSVTTGLPVLTSNTLAVLSALAVAKVLPDGLKATGVNLGMMLCHERLALGAADIPDRDGASPSSYG
jgi:hypothetical protein